MVTVEGASQQQDTRRGPSQGVGHLCGKCCGVRRVAAEESFNRRIATDVIDGSERRLGEFTTAQHLDCAANHQDQDRCRADNPIAPHRLRMLCTRTHVLHGIIKTRGRFRIARSPARTRRMVLDHLLRESEITSRHQARLGITCIQRCSRRHTEKPVALRLFFVYPFAQTIPLPDQTFVRDVVARIFGLTVGRGEHEVGSLAHTPIENRCERGRVFASCNGAQITQPCRVPHAALIPVDRREPLEDTLCDHRVDIGNSRFGLQVQRAIESADFLEISKIDRPHHPRVVPRFKCAAQCMLHEREPIHPVADIV